MQPLRTKKITEPLGTKKHYFGTKKSSKLWVQKSHATSPDKKKSCNLLWQKKQEIFWDKNKSHNLLGQKITQPLGTKKNHTTSRDKKIMQPLKTKQKITQPLGTNKSRNLWDKKPWNLLWQKKITLSIGSIAYKLVHRAPNYSKWHQTCANGSNRLE